MRAGDKGPPPGIMSWHCWRFQYSFDDPFHTLRMCAKNFIILCTQKKSSNIIPHLGLFNVHQSLLSTIPDLCMSKWSFINRFYLWITQSGKVRQSLLSSFSPHGKVFDGFAVSAHFNICKSWLQKWNSQRFPILTFRVGDLFLWSYSTDVSDPGWWWWSDLKGEDESLKKKTSHHRHLLMSGWFSVISL